MDFLHSSGNLLHKLSDMLKDMHFLHKYLDNHFRKHLDIHHLHKYLDILKDKHNKYLHMFCYILYN